MMVENNTLMDNPINGFIIGITSAGLSWGTWANAKLSTAMVSLPDSDLAWEIISKIGTLAGSIVAIWSLCRMIKNKFTAKSRKRRKSDS